MGVGFPHSPGQSGIDPYVDARFAQGERTAAADEAAGFVEREDGAFLFVEFHHLTKIYAWILQFLPID